MPAARTSEYEALTNLSISRSARDPRGERQADIVHKGETVPLTDEQAQGFMTRHRVPVIRPAAQQNSPAPPVRARDLFGQRPGPLAGARPDPPPDPDSTVFGLPLGASEVADPADPRNAPEANDPQTDLSVDPDAVKDK